ncbi:helix-turn-helix transcriptional regulator [Sulfurimonas sp. C5]|uniref:helix-turn-helix domain-containing protein n=1 Tax=Sulfurimonas sp. C5 TaxID=3036947 RepID=UPI002454584F|nr:helix-turn-helix transcriptional regulator [Sulfurimonas sp. C5]MDH4943954.1 helix-turn-helix transcriptional regulator [Sulfurimonas sp. C5]
MQVFPDINKEELDTFYKNIGKNVRDARNKKQVSQLELAIAIGHKSTSFLSNCENYKFKEHFNLEHLYLISKVLEVDICELIYGDAHNE